MINIFRPSKHTVTISPSIVVFTVFFVLSLFFLFYIRSILILLFLSYVLMTALHPWVKLFERKLKLGRGVSTSLVYVLLILGISLTISIIVPPLLDELRGLFSEYKWPFLLPIQNELKTFEFSLFEINNLINSLGSSVTTLINIVSSAFSGLFAFFTFMMISFYMMLDRENLYKRLAWFTDDRDQMKLAKEFFDSVEVQLGGWVRAQLILMILIGVVTYVGLILLAVPYALPLALLAGLLEILPNLGPVIATIPAAILSFFVGGPVTALLTVIFYTVVQQVEINFFVPKIMKENADVSPLATITAIVIGLKVAGVFGALLAVPLYIILRTAYSLWNKHIQ